MTTLCSREILQTQFNEWLAVTYSIDEIRSLDLAIEAQKWVASQGDAEGTDGFGVIMHCALCGQRTIAQQDGRFSMLDSDNVCRVAGEPAIVSIPQFNKQ